MEWTRSFRRDDTGSTEEFGLQFKINYLQLAYCAGIVLALRGDDFIPYLRFPKSPFPDMFML